MGKPGKLKSGTHSKVKKWAKGSSSSSNPEYHSHREKAKAKFFHMQPPSKSHHGLTLETLRIHDELNNDNSIDMQMSETADSESVGTFGTFLSGLSDCTNATFGKIQRYWLNNSAKHKEVCAVLAAITEVIRGQGGAESNTAYFAALVTALSSVEQVESAAAIAYLLSMTCKNVPVPVLQAKFAEVSKLLCDILAQNSATSTTVPTALIRSVISCLGTILRQQDISIWNDSSTLNIFNTVLTFIVHSKPKIRKASQNAVCSIICASGFMTDPEKKGLIHPASTTAAKVCIAHLERFGGMSADSSVCHVLSLLGRILHCFPQSTLKHCCETILRLMLLSAPVVKSVCLQTVYNMFLNKPNPAILSPDLNAQILTALYDYHPNSSDAQACPAWLSVMEKATQNLSLNYVNSFEQKAKLLAIAHIPKLIGTCFKMMLSPSMEVINAAASTAKVLLKECASTLYKGVDVANAEETKFVILLFKIFEDGLKYKFHAVWNLVFEIIEAAFKAVVKRSHCDIVKSVLINIVDLRNAPQFQYKPELDLAVGAAIEMLGPKLVLEITPLQIDGTESDYNFPRSWLLPVMKKSISHTEIAFFSEYFLPLAVKLRGKAETMKLNGHIVEAKTYETLQFQCWDLCPVFCKHATDIGSAFPGIARILGRALNDQNDLRLTVMQALRNIVISCKKSVKDQEVVGRFAKNYIPILLNIYTDIEFDDKTETGVKQKITEANKNKSNDRLGALETIKLYLTITDPSLICTYFLKAQSRVFEGDDANDATRLALLDLMISMVTYVSEDQINCVYKAMLPMLNSPNHSMQKKAYRLLEEICGSQCNTCRTFVSCHLSELKTLLLAGLSSASSPSKGPRIKCIEQVFLQLHCNSDTLSESVEFISVVVPEVILCTKEAKKSRLAAFNLLVSAAKAFMNDPISAGGENMEIAGTALTQYFTIIFTGLAGSPMMIRATIVALSRLIYEFRELMPSDLLDQTISNICLLLGCNTREVCKAALGFVMVLFSILPRPVLAQYTKLILDALLNWKPETRRHFRFRVKKILQRFVKKFGFETIYSMTPTEHKKQLQNVKKVEDRKKRVTSQRKLEKERDHDEGIVKKQKKETIDEILADSSDSDDEPEDRPNKSKKKQRFVKKSWLQDAQEDPIDLLDPSISQKVIGTNPKSGNTKSRSDFKMAPDGRLIIGAGESGSDDDDDAETNKVLTGLGIQNSTSKNMMNKQTKKRKLDDNDVDEDMTKHTSYQPGGKGIHRNLKHDETGVKYQAKNAGGDAKRKGAHEPYAYMPLNVGMLNKRKRKKLSGQFDGLIKAAKKGAASGRKMKLINDRKMKK